mgnify:CR=1 FL=1|jgi:uncharacterized membrane protein YcaP (DUF421 family)|nr:YetF domain-containing protein [uncultured Emticicia sp.]
MTEYFDLMLRAGAVYVFIVVAIKLFGKKELSQLSVVDLVFILLISNAVQNAMVGSNTSLAGGIVAASTLFIINYVLKKLILRFKPIERLIEGEPIMLIYEGEIQQSNVEKAGFTIQELNAAVREHGVDTIENVNLAMLEVDGNISVLSENYQSKTRKRRVHKILGESQ